MIIEADRVIGVNRYLHPFPTKVEGLNVTVTIPTDGRLLAQGGQHLELGFTFQRADLKVTVISFTRVFLFFVNLQLLNTARKKFRKFILSEQRWALLRDFEGSLRSEKYQDIDIPMLL